jgi:acetyltransferase-like isoleucine patch superfamily enzyme
MISKILFKIYSLALIIVVKVKIYMVRKAFLSNCITGDNFSCSVFSKCFNDTLRRDNVWIGNDCEVNGILRAKEKGRILIGNNTTIRMHSRVFAVNKIEIGNCVIISNNVLIYDNNNHPIEPERRLEMSKSGFYGDLWEAKHSISSPVLIHDNVWIGERAVILKGVTIGRGSIVAMGAIVTKNVPEFCVVAGNPAKVVKVLN